MKRTALHVAGVLLLTSIQAFSQGVAENVFVRALRDGHATMVMPVEEPFARVVRDLQSKTANAGAIELQATRIARFKQQPLCGRVMFVVAQPATKIAWSDMGGQLNICESGNPPMRVCDEHPEVLVEPAFLCIGGKSPHDTHEVSSAIAQAIKDGGLSREQVRAQLVQAQKNSAKKAPDSAAKEPTLRTTP